MRPQTLAEFHQQIDKVVMSANHKIHQLVRDFDELFGPEGDHWPPPALEVVRAGYKEEGE